MSSRSSRSNQALKGKLRIAELLAEAEFFVKKQSAKINEEKLNIEDKYAKFKAKVKIIEKLETPDIRRDFNLQNKHQKMEKSFISKQPKLQYQQRPSIWKHSQTSIEEGHVQFGIQ